MRVTAMPIDRLVLITNATLFWLAKLWTLSTPAYVHTQCQTRLL